MVRMSRDNFVIFFILIISVFLINHFNYQESGAKASIWANNEKDFFKSIDVIWSGKIISTMVSGSCIGLEGDFDNYTQAMACLPEARLLKDPNKLWTFKGMVTVTGKWLGITCAYKNTIFGECVPDVVIESIRQ